MIVTNGLLIDINGILYFREDWDLLSTLAPSVRAWCFPVNSIVEHVKCLQEKQNVRLVSIMAVVMTQAIEARHIHTQPKVT